MRENIERNREETQRNREAAAAATATSIQRFTEIFELYQQNPSAQILKGLKESADRMRTW